MPRVYLCSPVATIQWVAEHDKTVDGTTCYRLEGHPTDSVGAALSVLGLTADEVDDLIRTLQAVRQDSDLTATQLLAKGLCPDCGVRAPDHAPDCITQPLRVGRMTLRDVLPHECDAGLAVGGNQYSDPPLNAKGPTKP